MRFTYNFHKLNKFHKNQEDEIKYSNQSVTEQQHIKGNFLPRFSKKIYEMSVVINRVAHHKTRIIAKLRIPETAKTMITGNMTLLSSPFPNLTILFLVLTLLLG